MNFTKTIIKIAVFLTTIFMTQPVMAAPLPAYTGEPFVAINNNIPNFSPTDIQNTTSFEIYAELDALGRCGICFANVGLDIMPTEERKEIGQIKPSGWVQAKYPDLIAPSPGYLYNRCHLIGYQLTAENANKNNLITGTRYLNVVGMLPFEDLVANYVKTTGNHVLYRATPRFEGNNLVASGVQIEAWSVEDSGKGVCFNIYAFNVQPGITIDYATGNSTIAATVPIAPNITEPVITSTSTIGEGDYILHTNSKKFHLPTCGDASRISAKNKSIFTGTREELINQGYDPCKKCNP